MHAGAPYAYDSDMMSSSSAASRYPERRVMRGVRYVAFLHHRSIALLVLRYGTYLRAPRLQRFLPLRNPACAIIARIIAPSSFSALLSITYAIIAEKNTTKAVRPR